MVTPRDERQRHGKVTGDIAQDAVAYFVRAVAGVNPGAAGFRVDHPNGGDAEGEVVVDLVLDVGGAVVGGEDFDGDLRRRGDVAAFWFLAPDDDDVGDAEAFGLDLDSDFDAGPEAGLGSEDVRVGAALRVAMADFCCGAVLDAAFEVFAVRVVGVLEVVGERDAHSGSLAAADPAHLCAILLV